MLLLDDARDKLGTEGYFSYRKGRTHQNATALAVPGLTPFDEAKCINAQVEFGPVLSSEHVYIEWKLNPEREN